MKSTQKLDLTDTKFIEDPNPHKNPDVIDVTNLDDEEEHYSKEQDELNENKNATFSHKKYKKNSEKDSAFKPMKWAYRSWLLERGIFIEDSASINHMTIDPTGLYNLQKISGSVMNGNGQNIKCTQKGLLDAMHIQNDGSTTRDTQVSNWYHKCIMIFLVP